MFDAIVISVHKYDSHQDAALDLLRAEDSKLIVCTDVIYLQLIVYNPL